MVALIASFWSISKILVFEDFRYLAVCLFLNMFLVLDALDNSEETKESLGSSLVLHIIF